MPASATAHPRPDERSPRAADPVAVVGLGPMGAALARALLRAGAPTVVWNRTASRAWPLADDGARVAGTLHEAVTAAGLVVVCLRDAAAYREAFGALDPGTLQGRAVVHLSTATPAEARRTAAWATERGTAHLHGAITSTTPMIGTPGSLVLYSGPRAVFDRHRARLEAFGAAEHLGEDPGLASLLDTAVLGVFFAGMTSFLHAAAMTTANGVSAVEFLPHAQRIVSLLPATFAGLASDVDAGAYPGEEDQLAMDAAGLDHVVRASEDSGVDPALPAVLRDLARRAVDAGHGTDGFSRVVEFLRRP
ncbi:NAD(P)-dependent oxidoreductase [Geodermatophilus sp. SYSU D01119]